MSDVAHRQAAQTVRACWFEAGDASFEHYRKGSEPSPSPQSMGLLLMEHRVPARPFAENYRLPAPRFPSFSIPNTRILPRPISPKMGIKMYRVPPGGCKARKEGLIFTPIFGEASHFPEDADKWFLSFFVSHLGCHGNISVPFTGTLRRDPCARHGKVQQVVSCPPRFAPGRLSLRSVRPSVERRDLAGGGSPLPTPSPQHKPAFKHAPHPGPRPQTQFRGDAR